MSAIAMTKSLDDLRASCKKNGIPYLPGDSKEELINRLRAHLAEWSTSIEIPDPMKAKNLQELVDPTLNNPYSRLSQYYGSHMSLEPKYDGCRMMVLLGDEVNQIYSPRRSVKTFGASLRTDNFPHLRDDVLDGMAETLLDGELLAPGPRIQTHTGTWTDSLLNASVALCNSNPVSSAATQAKFGLATFVAFDVLNVQGNSVMTLTYSDRRGMLESIIATMQTVYPYTRFRISPRYEASSEGITTAIDAGYEGVVLKSNISAYKPGSRSGGWYKIKTLSSADGFVTGWEPGKGSNDGKVGSLEISVYDSGGDAVIVAQVGNLTDAMRNEITAPDGSLQEWVYGMVVEFAGQGMTKGFKVRHPRLMRLRPDKIERECLKDQLTSWTRV